jgi:polysaccharide export outer membrane protein
MKNLLYSIFLLFLIFSCSSPKEIVYLQYDEVDQLKVINDFETIFKSDDLIQIVVSAQDYLAVIPFNLPAVASAITSKSVIGTPVQQSYLIDSKGEINFPILGKIKLGGLTREQAIELLKNKISPSYVKNPIINITISNFKVTVLGEVNRPGSFVIPNERITVFEALGLAGDMTIAGKRDNVLITREEGGRKIIKTLNLLSKKSLNSPYYYLKQNDLVYVQPNNSRAQDAAYTRSTGLFISLASVLISLITVLTR